MHDSENYADRELDRILDEALASYADAEPDPSLLARTFARISEAGTPWRRMWHYGSLTAAAALLLAFLLHPAKRTLDDRAGNAPVITAVPMPSAAISSEVNHAGTHSIRPRMVAATHSHNSRKPAISRRGISFASAPLTEEEATLLRFAQEHPEQAREVLRPPLGGPIHIEPVIIAPIQVAVLSASQPDTH